MADKPHEIEEAFLASWDKIELFYEDRLSMDSWQWYRPMVDLLAEFRQRGYDRKLRAQQSHQRLLLTRLRVHQAPHRDKPRLYVQVLKSKGMLMEFFDGTNISEYRSERVAITEELEELLSRLIRSPIA